MAPSSTETPGRGGRTTVSLSLPGGPGAAAEAREHLASCSAWLPPALRSVVPLLLTELVTNAVRHGGASSGSKVGLTVNAYGGGLRVGVTDSGDGFEWRGRDTNWQAEEGGYGLVLVDQMAARWGIDRRGGSTTVWFELWADSYTSR